MYKSLSLFFTILIALTSSVESFGQYAPVPGAYRPTPHARPMGAPAVQASYALPQGMPAPNAQQSPYHGMGSQAYSSGYSSQDWNRLYHYPYVNYPQNYWGQEYYQSRDDMYKRYPPEMQVPVYNPDWHNYYPEERPYYQGHHFKLDVF